MKRNKTKRLKIYIKLIIKFIYYFNITLLIFFYIKYDLISKHPNFNFHDKVNYKLLYSLYV